MSKWTAVNGVAGGTKAVFANEDFQALARSIGDKPCQLSSAFLCECAISLCQLPWAAVPDACSHVAGG